MTRKLKQLLTNYYFADKSIDNLSKVLEYLKGKDRPWVVEGENLVIHVNKDDDLEIDGEH